MTHKKKEYEWPGYGYLPTTPFEWAGPSTVYVLFKHSDGRTEVVRTEELWARFDGYTIETK